MILFVKWISLFEDMAATFAACGIQIANLFRHIHLDKLIAKYLRFKNRFTLYIFFSLKHSAYNAKKKAIFKDFVLCVNNGL